MDWPDYEHTFPSTIAVPEGLRRLRAWVQQQGYPISGSFELRAEEAGSIRAWFGTDRAVAALAMFGAGGDGSPYALWRQGDGRTPVVHLGSEGGNNFVLAPDFGEFLRLLAIGYEEIGFADLTLPPSGAGANPVFQSWVRQSFSVEIPACGSQIVEPAQREHDDFAGWVQRQLEGRT